MVLPTALLPLLLALTPALSLPTDQKHGSSACAPAATVTVTASSPPTSTATPSAPQPFGIITARSGSAIHLQEVNAHAGFFFIGEPTTSYCPLEDQSTCPAGTETVLVAADGFASLDVEVPGGQRIFVTPSGALGFTQAHSASLPAGAVTEGFSYTPGLSFGYFGFSGLGATGFVGCPVNATSAFGPWQVFAEVEGFVAPNNASCLGFDALAPNATGLGAWQYI